jgi:hypothetical protein
MWIASAQSTVPAVRLEAGIAKEEVDGDLRSATEIYQKIAADPSAPRDVRAKALLHIGGCYEKLGKQARQVYEQVVRDYADQPAASQARTRLAALKQQEHAAIPATMTARKIEQSPLGELIAADTDGQRVVYRDTTGSIFIGDLTGHTKRLVYKNQEAEWPGFIPSRDLSMVAIFNRQRVAVIKTDGTGYREIIPNDAQGNYWESGYPGMCCRWSWDNHYLLIPINGQTAGGRLLVVSVSDGRYRELLSVTAVRL